MIAVANGMRGVPVLLALDPAGEAPPEVLSQIGSEPGVVVDGSLHELAAYFLVSLQGGGQVVRVSRPGGSYTTRRSGMRRPAALASTGPDTFFVDNNYVDLPAQVFQGGELLLELEGVAATDAVVTEDALWVAAIRGADERTGVLARVPLEGGAAERFTVPYPPREAVVDEGALVISTVFAPDQDALIFRQPLP